MDKENKVKRTFLLKPTVLEYLKNMSNDNDFSINEMLEKCIMSYNQNKKTVKFNKCPVKYGFTGKE